MILLTWIINVPSVPVQLLNIRVVNSSKLHHVAQPSPLHVLHHIVFSSSGTTVWLYNPRFALRFCSSQPIFLGQYHDFICDRSVLTFKSLLLRPKLCATTCLLRFKCHSTKPSSLPPFFLAIPSHFPKTHCIPVTLFHSPLFELQNPLRTSQVILCSNFELHSYFLFCCCIAGYFAANHCFLLHFSVFELSSSFIFRLLCDSQPTSFFWHHLPWFSVNYALDWWWLCVYTITFFIISDEYVFNFR